MNPNLGVLRFDWFGPVEFAPLSVESVTATWFPKKSAPSAGALVDEGYSCDSLSGGVPMPNFTQTADSPSIIRGLEPAPVSKD